MPSFLEQLLGSKPQVPNMPVTTLTGSQTGTIAANQSSLPGAESLVGATNQFSRDQITQMLNSAIPGYDQMLKSAGTNIESELRGEIPKDVQDAVRNSGAASAVASGTAGSDFSRNLVARDLGLTSLDLTHKGLASAEGWMKTASSMYEPSMMNVSSMFISPMQAYETGNQQATQQFGNDWMRNQVAAMPDPTVVGEWNMSMGAIESILKGATGASGGASGGL